MSSLYLPERFSIDGTSKYPPHPSNAAGKGRAYHDIIGALQNAVSAQQLTLFFFSRVERRQRFFISQVIQSLQGLDSLEFKYSQASLHPVSIPSDPLELSEQVN